MTAPNADISRFTFFGSYFEAISKLPDEHQGDFYKALVAYAFTGEEPDFDGADAWAMQALFLAIKPNIDASMKQSRTNASNAAKSDRENDRKNDRMSDRKNDEIKPSRKGKDRKRNSNLPLEEDSNSSASGGAVTAEAAPPEACPECGADLIKTETHTSDGRRFYRCNRCGSEVVGDREDYKTRFGIGAEYG